MWMFCEGFYLRRLISNAFAEEKNLMLFYIIGWGEYNSFFRNGSFKLFDGLCGIYLPSPTKVFAFLKTAAVYKTVVSDYRNIRVYGG
jgi:hypothetical protein